VTWFNPFAVDLADRTTLGVLLDHMEGLRFDDADSYEETVNSAFVLIGRVTGRQLDRDWLDATHTRAVIPPAGSETTPGPGAR
jgi:hypothetical protein